MKKKKKKKRENEKKTPLSLYIPNNNNILTTYEIIKPTKSNNESLSVSVTWNDSTTYRERIR
jgi:hypothetical protein